MNISILLSLLLLAFTQVNAQLFYQVIATSTTCSESGASLTPPTIEICAQTCLSSSSCVYFNYISSTNLCRMFDEPCTQVAGPNDLYTVASTGFPTSSPTPPTNAPTTSPTSVCVNDGVCLNDGVCNNSYCMCRFPYHGVWCENINACECT